MDRPRLLQSEIDLFLRQLTALVLLHIMDYDGAHERLLSVELIARNCQGLGGSRSVVATTQLPDLSDPNKLQWPPPGPNMAAEMAMAFASPPDKRFTSKWWEANQEIDQGRRQLQEQRIKEEEEQKFAAQQDYHNRVSGFAK